MFHFEFQLLLFHISDISQYIFWDKKVYFRYQ